MVLLFYNGFKFKLCSGRKVGGISLASVVAKPLNVRDEATSNIILY